MLDTRDVPVYLFAGLLDSGKTTFFKETLRSGDFVDGSRSIYILCEQGEVELGEKILKKNELELIVVEDKETISEDFFIELDEKYKPDRVIIENNGMWPPSFLEDFFPENWMLLQCVTLVDGSTFENYIANMGSLLFEQIKPADLVVFTRINDKEIRGSFRRRIKAVNRKAQIVFDDGQGNLDDAFSESLPFDITKDIIELDDEDFGIWYLDALDHPKKYHGKKVKFRAFVFKDKKLPEGKFVPGRFAMTCCAADITFIGFLCIAPDVEAFESKDWVEVVASVKYEYCKEYREKGVVLYADEPLKPVPKGEELVYFT